MPFKNKLWASICQRIEQHYLRIFLLYIWPFVLWRHRFALWLRICAPEQLRFSWVMWNIYKIILYMILYSFISVRYLLHLSIYIFGEMKNKQTQLYIQTLGYIITHQKKTREEKRRTWKNSKQQTIAQSNIISWKTCHTINLSTPPKNVSKLTWNHRQWTHEVPKPIVSLSHYISNCHCICSPISLIACAHTSGSGFW